MHRIIKIFTTLIFVGGLASTAAAAKIDVACMQAAVEKRDSAVMIALDAYANTLKSDLETRKDSLKSAWKTNGASAMRRAINSAWSAWRKSAREARAGFNGAKRNAWSQFYRNRLACGKGAAAEDRTTGAVDNNL